MLGYILRFFILILIVIGIAFLFPALMIFFLQVLITVCIFLCILYIISLFYKGDGDER